MPKDLYEQLQHLSTSEKRPLNDILTNVIATWWSSHPKHDAIVAFIRDIPK